MRRVYARYETTVALPVEYDYGSLNSLSSSGSSRLSSRAL